MSHLARARQKLLVDIVTIFAAGACVPLAAMGCTPTNKVAPTTDGTPPKGGPTADGPGEGAPAAECPEARGTFADWPGGTPPEYWSGVGEVCLPVPPGGEKACGKAYSNECIMSRFVCGKSHGGQSVEGRLASHNPEVCCWKVKGHCAMGRPFMIDGAAVLAETRPGDGYRDDATTRDTRSLEAAIAALDPDTRRAIAGVWERDGLTEHASVASFATVILELLALGAPSTLIHAAQRAMGDEIRHAERAFTLASRYGERAVEPGALPIAGVLREPPSLAAFAARAASEGCVAETVAALQLHAAADVARDPSLASLLRTTADEESEHALFAWRVVRWAIDVGGAPVRSAVQAVFADAESHVGFGPCPDGDVDAAALRAHGVLPEADRHVLAVHALASVVMPAAATLACGDAAPATRPIAQA